MEEEGNVCSRIYAPQLEDVPELIYRIQSLLPPKEAARTCVLSKSWLYAWSTIPTLTFTKSDAQHKINYMKLVGRTFQRYFLDNISIVNLDLYLPIKNQKSACLAKYWIQSVGSKSCLNKVSLTISNDIDLFTLPSAEIFASENLNTLSIKVDESTWFKHVCVSDYSVINCVNLRVLELVDVNISKGLLDKLFSTCTLLEKIHLHEAIDSLKRIKVKKLRYLNELKITSKRRGIILETDDLPSLRLFCYESLFLASNMGSLGNVTELILKSVKLDNAFFDLIKSKFHFLETLDLDIEFRCINLKRLDITCASLKKLILQLRNSVQVIDIQVDAPKLLYFCYGGNTMPSLLFQTAPEQIKLRLVLGNPINERFFLNLREALDLSSKFYIDITIKKLALAVPLNFDDLRRRVSSPAPNVQELSLKTTLVSGLRKHSRFVYALFTICHPSYVKVDHEFCKVMVNGALTKKTSNLKNVEIKIPDTGKWETIKSSWRGFHEGSAYEFKLNWCS